MNIITLLDTLKDAIANDEDTRNWCKLTYGQDHKVYVNVDRRNQPGSGVCPYTCIYPKRKVVGQGVEEKIHGFECICVIHDEESETFVEANITQYKGVDRLEEFRKYVETALAGASIGNLLLNVIEIEYDTIEVFPFMMAAMMLEFTEAVTLGLGVNQLT